jgi:hypothetical protein
MASKHQEVGVEGFHLLATEWPGLRDVLSSVALRQPGSQVADTLAALSRSRTTWELAVTSAAYSRLRSPRILADRPHLVHIADALTTLRGRAKLPEFVDVANQVSTLPWRTLIRGAPRFAATLRRGQWLITSASFECTLLCMQRFRRGSPEFMKCLQDCND